MGQTTSLMMRAGGLEMNNFTVWYVCWRTADGDKLTTSDRAYPYVYSMGYIYVGFAAPNQHDLDKSRPLQFVQGPIRTNTVILKVDCGLLLGFDAVKCKNNEY
eukprot:5676428-Pleurochrysis_carterae.AAC.5